MATTRLHRRIRYALGVFRALVIAWMFFNMQAHDVPASDLESDMNVQVTPGSSEIAFVPAEDTARVGLVFYPGALVDPVSYAPLARDVAEAGFQVIIKKLPFRLAPLSSQQTHLFDETERLMTSEDDSTRMIRIEGANHAHFAWYGWQLGDHSASISRAVQHDRTVQAVVTFLGGLGSDAAGFGER